MQLAIGLISELTLPLTMPMSIGPMEAEGAEGHVSNHTVNEEFSEAFVLF